ncbi:MAG TPA: Sip1-related alpha-galactosidase [Chryseolinea sp.]|nr:Sip1-related alpha-galactosidase [Chryseolinea sp.]
MKTYLLLLLLIISIAGNTQQVDVFVDRNDTITVKWNGTERLLGGAALINNGERARLSHKIVKDVVLLNVIAGGRHINDTLASGVFFSAIPQFKKSVVLWRYKPWNSWTKPISLNAAEEMPADDVQFFYWQYEDGGYGAAVPLNGNGFRTTIGNNGNRWGSKALTYAITKVTDTIPALAVAFGNDPFELFERIYRISLQAMGKEENLLALKKFPEPFNYIGWCTWNASSNGKNLNEQLLLKAAKSFSDNHFPLGWMLIDDGWFQNNDKRLQSYRPNPKQFPKGFKPVLDELKNNYGIKYMGVWHTINGLWNGIDPGSQLGKRFAPEMFTWTQKINPDRDSTGVYSFIKPDSDSLNIFFDEWHRYLKLEGFDFVKIDNQVVIERMARGNYPIFSLSDSIHKALYRSVKKYFNNAILNCMDMTAEAYFNFGSTAVARSEEDYFPYKPGETYDLQHGNAAAHVLQAVYNSIYFGQMVYPDFDIFQSHNPNAIFHAIARAINCGPIYITDNVGEQDFSVLRPLVYSDGRIIRSETPLLPTRDCLFQVQDASLFKASSSVRDAGLLGVWNAADVDKVKGMIQPRDVRNLKGNDFVVYEYFSKKLVRASYNDSFAVSLGRMGYRLYDIVPLRNGFAALGLINKYNSAATILSQQVTARHARIVLYEGGNFGAYCPRRPSKVSVNGKPISDFHFSDHFLTLEVPVKPHPSIEIKW